SIILTAIFPPVCLPPQSVNRSVAKDVLIMPIPYELYDSPPSNPADNASAIPTLRVRLVHGAINQFTPADPCLDHPDPRPQNNSRRLRRRLSVSGRARFTVDD